MGRYLRSTFVVIVLFVASGACGDAASPGNSKHTGQASSDVRVMQASARQSLNKFDFDVSNNRGTLRFDASNAFAQKIE